MSTIIQKNIPLAPYTTLKIGGPADYFAIVSNADELIEALAFARKTSIPYYVIGSGSNVLVSDSGFQGLVIKLKLDSLVFEETTVIAGAGVILPILAKETAERGLSGLEFCIGVPGSVGGAVYGNAGAFGQEIKDTLKEVRVLMEKNDVHALPISHVKYTSAEENPWVTARLENNACAFSYRESIFKKHKNWIILEAVFELLKETKETAIKRMNAMLSDKKTTQPMGEMAAGSIFKNPPYHSAWELIDKAGMRGYAIHGARVSPQHANYIVNTCNATAKDMTALIKTIKQRVKERFGVALQEEIQYIGF